MAKVYTDGLAVSAREATTADEHQRVDFLDWELSLLRQSASIIRPPHINDREESSFKKGLMEALSKPFCQEEYDKLYGMATIREPLMRERRTRSGSKSYYSNSWMGKSYFDSYPDLAEQIKETSYPNCLALLQGLFYWLQNIIWPPHINDREESSFKQGLIEVLSKPFCQEEHDELYGMATIREPSMSERRTRSGSKTYYSNLGWANHILIPTQEEPSFKQGLIDALSKPFCPREYDKLYGMATVREPSMWELRTRSGSKTYYSNSWMGKSYLVPTQAPHINNREESSFKQGLIEVSSKPFCQEEHDKLYGMSTISEPSMRKRQTRCGSKTYYSNPG
uniref:Uncharacterized protein n=1 Tax=Oryza glumipatula TaxID=40148 RepID=A0A0E0BUN3_9ORYZ